MTIASREAAVSSEADGCGSGLPITSGSDASRLETCDAMSSRAVSTGVGVGGVESASTIAAIIAEVVVCGGG